MRATASLCFALARGGGCELLLPGERRTIGIDPAMRAWPEAHVRIAVSDLGATPLLSPQPRGAAVIWVSAASFEVAA
jgi:enoyl-CoA hydratase/carnithine racemase